MYYSTPNKKMSILKVRNCFFLLFCSFSVATFHSNVFAEAQKPTFEELRMLGFTKQEEGNLDEALAYYLQASNLDPKKVNVLNDIGVIYEQMGLIDRAELMYQQAVALDPNYLPPLMNLASLYEKKGDTAKAIEYLKKRIDAGAPDDIWTQKARQRLAEIYNQFPEFKKRLVDEQKGDLEREIAEQRKAEKIAQLKNQLAKAEGHYEEGMKKLEQKKFAEAAEDFEQALSITPSNTRYAQARTMALKEDTKRKIQNHFNAAMDYWDHNDNARASDEIQKILTLIPDDNPLQETRY